MKLLAKILPAGVLGLAIGLGSLGLVGCGDQTWNDLRDPLRPSGGRPDADAGTPPANPGDKGTSGKPWQPQVIPSNPNAPVETYVENGLRIPVRLKAAGLTLRFRSNFDDVTFECAEDQARVMTPCALGGAFDFGRLVHNRAYVLRVRAVKKDGRADQTPLTVAFVADLTGGSPVIERGPDAPVIPGSAAALPAAGGGGARLLQVGSFYGVQTPASYLVTSYATTKNFNSALVSIRMTGRPELSSATGARACDATYERPTIGPDAISYCEATPTRSQWETDFGVPMPMNHLEIVRTGGTDVQNGTASEKLLVAAYDASEDDVTDGRMGIGDTCRSAISRGETLVPLVYGFYDPMPTKVPFTWCQVQDRYGRSWWIGAFTDALGASVDPDAPKMSVIYTADAQLGIFSGSQFAARAGNFIAPVLVPIAPTPDP